MEKNTLIKQKSEENENIPKETTVFEQKSNNCLIF